MADLGSLAAYPIYCFPRYGSCPRLLAVSIVRRAATRSGPGEAHKRRDLRFGGFTAEEKRA